MKKCNPKTKKPNTICNPKTGKWVKIDGKIGKALIAQGNVSVKSTPNTVCNPKTKKPNTVCNPKTGKWVKTYGKAGKALIAQGTVSVKSTDNTICNPKTKKPNTVCNPKTGKWVKIDGKAGKALIASGVCKKEIYPSHVHEGLKPIQKFFKYYSHNSEEIKKWNAKNLMFIPSVWKHLNITVNPKTTLTYYQQNWLYRSLNHYMNFSLNSYHEYLQVDNLLDYYPQLKLGKNQLQKFNGYYDKKTTFEKSIIRNIYKRFALELNNLIYRFATPIPKRVIVFRGMKLNSLLTLKKGDIVRGLRHSFFSTSESAKVAKTFQQAINNNICNKNKGFKADYLYCCLLKIEIPAGFRALRPSNITNIMTKEKELLLPSGTFLRITDDPYVHRSSVVIPAKVIIQHQHTPTFDYIRENKIIDIVTGKDITQAQLDKKIEENTKTFCISKEDKYIDKMN